MKETKKVNSPDGRFKKNFDKKPDSRGDKRFDKKFDKKNEFKSEKRFDKNDDRKFEKRYDKKDDRKFEKRYDKNDDRKFEKRYDKKDDRKFEKRYDKKDDRKFEKRYDKKDDRKFEKRYDKNDDRKFEKRYDKNDDRKFEKRYDKNDDRKFEKRYDKKDDRKFEKRYDKNDDRKFEKRYDKNDNRKFDKRDGRKFDKNSDNRSDKRFGNEDDRQSRGREKSNVDCPVYHRCGGCSLRHVSYKDQLAHKNNKVNNLLCNYGYVNDIIGMENPYHYRNKVHATFGRLKNGTYISGVYEEGTHFIVPIETCLIEDEKADAIVGTIRGLLKSFKIRTYDEDTGYGLLRHVLIRTGHKSGEVMVVLVLASPILPSKNNFVKALREEHPEITTVVINVNDKNTSMVLGDKQTTIYGKGFIEDELCGCKFRISPKSFYQVNPIQTEILYNKAIELADLTGTERVIDAYCGIGTIGLIASKHAKEVIGVELNKDAVKDAVVNAKANGISNVSFYNNDAGKFMVELAEAKEHIDVVFMDPPRSGSDEAFLSSVVTLGPDKIVYISCSPETLEEDLEYLTSNGYKARNITPVDMFPWTSHVETVVRLDRVK